MSFLAGLFHLEHLYSIINKGENNVELDVIHLDDIHNCYASLRQIDEAEPLSDKHIFLDLSSVDAFNAVLSQASNHRHHHHHHHHHHLHHHHHHHHHHHQQQHLITTVNIMEMAHIIKIIKITIQGTLEQ